MLFDCPWFRLLSASDIHVGIRAKRPTSLATDTTRVRRQRQTMQTGANNNFTVVPHPERQHTRHRLPPDTGALGTGKGTALGATGAATLIGAPTGILDTNTVICDEGS